MYNFLKYKRNWKKCPHCSGKMERIKEGFGDSYKLCLVYDYYWPKVKRFGVINIHHKIPVHTLDKDKLHLIWDKNNLIALCPDCHNKQDHQLKTKVDPFIHFRKITEFLNEVN